MNIDMKNKKVIITGGSTGIGKEVVKVFAKNGAKVAIFDVNNEYLNSKLLSEARGNLAFNNSPRSSCS